MNGQWTSFAKMDRKDLLQQFIIIFAEAFNSLCLNILGNQYITVPALQLKLVKMLRFLFWASQLGSDQVTVQFKVTTP